MKKTILNFCIIWILILLYGCTPEKKTIIRIPPEEPIDFKYVTVKETDTFSTLAQKHIGSAKLAWWIEEFNLSRHLLPGQEIIIPLKPFKPGGLSARGYQVIPVLSYHNFSKGPSKNKLNVSANDFRQQLAYLQSNNYHVITMDQLIEFLDFGQLPEKSVLISIDDGWRSSYDIAYPILKEFGFSATLFVPTKFINSGHKLALTWSEIRSLTSDNTMDIQCHTKSHRDLSALKPGESFNDYIKAIDHDISYSSEIINKNLGKPVSALAYPFGKTNPLVMEIIKKHGYKTAFTVKRKSNAFFNNSFLLNRAMIFGDFKLEKFVENLTSFESYSIDTLEPVDLTNSFANIDSNNPEVYIERNQWRTALLAWKLKRDKLISKRLTIFSSKSVSDKVLAELYHSIGEAKKNISLVKSKLNDISRQFYLSALNATNEKDSRKALLQTLLYNPEDKLPIELFQTDMGKLKPMDYIVKENDNFETIARQLYQDSKKAILIPFFNENIKSTNDLYAGMNLTLPSLPVGLKISKTKINVEPKIEQKCGINMTKGAEEMAEDFYQQAVESFSHDQISSAIKDLTKATCLQPNYHDAREMLNMLKDLEESQLDI